MNNIPPIDESAGHRWFSASFFNRTWDLMDKPERTDDEIEQMISLCHASLAHWRLRTDCQPINMSVGYWQAARVYALARRPAESLRYARLCFAASQEVGPFYLGYAYEALARAALIAHEESECEKHLAAARAQASLIPDAESRAALEADLDGISELI